MIISVSNLLRLQTRRLILLREAIVMSLETCIGAERNVFEETPDHAHRVILTTPVLSASKFTRLRDNR